jgi:hypothetical protein
MAGEALALDQSADPGLRRHDPRLCRLRYAWTADDTSPDTQTIELPRINGQLLTLLTDPDGTTPPTDDYDVTLIDEHGFDRLQGVGLNRDTANTEEALVVYSATGIHPYVTEFDVLTLTIENNAVASAGGVIVLTYLAIPV